jgi:hypothetical protein
LWLARRSGTGGGTALGAASWSVGVLTTASLRRGGTVRQHDGTKLRSASLA